jgi:nitrogen fixation/metabolism regulation signal transduction histidine kinase
MADQLNMMSMAMLAILVVIAVIFVAVLVRAIKVASGRGAKRESGGESVMLSMALQDALMKLKQQERAMAARAEASERVAEQIVEGLTSGLVVVNRAGVVQAINPAARRILDLGNVGAGKPFREVLGSASALADLIAEALKGTAPIARRTITLADGKPRHLGVTVSHIVGDDGSPQAAVILFTDLTEVMQLEEQLRLKEALARLGELTAGLAHEFRNGLATIHGYGKLLDPQTLPPQAATCVEGIRSETTALGEVVTNFLRFARPEQLTLAPVDLKAVINKAIDDVPGAANAVVLEGTFPTVDGDDVLLRRAFNNLIRNSIDACESTGMPPKIHIRSNIVNGEAQVMIEDNGPGFAPEYLPKIFQPFATTKANGTGLGLAIVQKVVVSHNGSVTAGNAPEGGAQFRMRLPVAGAS